MPEQIIYCNCYECACNSAQVDPKQKIAMCIKKGECPKKIKKEN